MANIAGSVSRHHSRRTITGNTMVKNNVLVAVLMNSNHIQINKVYTPAGERPHLAAGWVLWVRRGGLRPASRDRADRHHETHYNTSLTSREPAQPKPLQLSRSSRYFRFSSRFFSSNYVYYTIKTDEETKVWYSLACWVRLVYPADNNVTHNRPTQWGSGPASHCYWR